jgi:hypothetical protein
MCTGSSPSSIAIAGTSHLALPASSGATSSEINHVSASKHGHAELSDRREVPRPDVQEKAPSWRED